MTVTSLVAIVVPHTSKIIKNGLGVLKLERTCYKMVYYTLYWLFWKGPGLKGL